MLNCLLFWACASNGPTTAPPVVNPSTETEVTVSDGVAVDLTSTVVQDPTFEPEMWTLSQFQQPESVLIDFETSRMWVSNIVGQPDQKDGLGQILELNLDGQLISEDFTSGLTLNAPKGMCILDDSLYIADIDVIHVVSVHTGQFRYDVSIEGAAFLNDLVCGFNEAYVSDSRNGRIHRIYKEGKSELVGDLSPMKPNGLAIQGIHLFVADFASSTVLRLLPTGQIDEKWTVPTAGLDGVAVLRDRSVVVSSWEGQAIYQLSPDGTVNTLAEGVKSPADFAVDQRHNRLIVPQLTENHLRIIPMGWPGQKD